MEENETPIVEQNVTTDPIVESGNNTPTDPPKIPTKRGPYKKRKKKKSSRSKGGKSEVKKEPPIHNPEPNPGEGEADDLYKRAKAKYMNDLDKDAREDKDPPPPEIPNDPSQTGGKVPEAPVAAKVEVKQLGDSLIVLTHFVLPTLCALAVRLISRNKQKPKAKLFRLDEFEEKMLEKLSDEAADELIGGINKGYIYLIVVFALGANKVMDYQDMVEAGLKEENRDLIELRKKFEELEKKYNEIIPFGNTEEVG